MNTLGLKKKGLALVVATATAFCFATPAFANNHADSGYSAYLTGPSTSDTPNRQKQDASYGYIYASSVSSGRTINAWMLGFNNENVDSQTVQLTSGQARYVSNYTYEYYGKKQVHMRLRNAQNYSGTTSVSGLWSPDSV